MNERYANVQMIVFVSMTYGVSMPVLFPLCFIFLLVNYIMERLMVIYFYRKPPMLDDELNNRALQMMKWAALLFALNGYWVFSNRQIFSNDITPKTRASAIEITNHTVFKLHDDNSQLLLWASIAMALIFVLVEVVNALKNCLFTKSKKKELMEIEDLPNYYAGLYKKDIDTIVKEEANMRQNLGFKKLADDTLDKMYLALTKQSSFRDRRE